MTLFFSCIPYPISQQSLELYFANVPRIWPNVLFLPHHEPMTNRTASTLGPKSLFSICQPDVPFKTQTGACSSPAQMIQQLPSHLCESQKPRNNPHNLQDLTLNLWSPKPTLKTPECSPTHLSLTSCTSSSLCMEAAPTTPHSIELAPSPSSSLYLNATLRHCSWSPY